MLPRLRTTAFAWVGALVLALSASGLVAAANLFGDTSLTTDGTTTPPVATDTTTFVDLNGDGIAHTCQTDVVADPTAADAAFKAADANADGTISVDEAAHTDWVGGNNCNHGGYVSGVAQSTGDQCASGTPAGSPDGGDAGTPDGTTLVTAGDQGSNGDEGTDQSTESETDQSAQGDCSAGTPQATTDQSQTPPVCQPLTPETPASTTTDQAPTDTSPSAHGLAVSTVAQSDAVGGKNCNHGGAVSEAARTAHGADVHGNAAKHATGKAPKQPKGKGHRWGHAPH